MPATFLVPAFNASHKAQFSSTATRSSKIGRATLPLPPDVTFTVHEPVILTSKRAVVRAQALPTVEVTGPLGKLSMTIPSFVRIKEIDEGRGRSVSVEDTTDKKQRAMWGEYGDATVWI